MYKLFLLFLLLSCHSNNRSLDNKEVCNNNQIEKQISQKCFYDLIAFFLKHDSFQDLEEEKIILFIKLINTLSLNQSLVSKEVKYNLEQIAFSNKDVIFQKMAFSVSKGMGLYAEKYNLHYGGAREMMLKSSFEIE